MIKQGQFLWLQVREYRVCKGLEQGHVHREKSLPRVCTTSALGGAWSAMDESKVSFNKSMVCNRFVRGQLYEDPGIPKTGTRSASGVAVSAKDWERESFSMSRVCHRLEREVVVIH